jgi:hypothetical protein
MSQYNTEYKIHGLIEGVQYRQNARTDELNSRISSRQFSDSPLEPNYSPRPVSTKYSKFPIMESKKPVKEMGQTYRDFSLRDNFNPGTQKAPPSGFLSNVDTETVLRNQCFALQRGDQCQYVPTTNSELYKVSVISNEREQQPYPLLFMRPYFDQTPHPNIQQSSNIGKETFFNHTRTQLRGIPE